MRIKGKSQDEWMNDEVGTVERARITYFECPTKAREGQVAFSYELSCFMTERDRGKLYDCMQPSFLSSLQFTTLHSTLPPPSTLQPVNYQP